MSRTSIYKLLYAVVIATGSVAAVAAWVFLRPYPLYLVLLMLILFLPGRLIGHFWRDFFIGKNLLALRDYEGSLRHTRLFLQRLDQQPWIRFFLFGSWAFHTWNAKAMALNNLAAAHIELGRFDTGEGSLLEALDIDPLYPMPHLNLAILHYAQGNDEQAALHRQKAIDLGIRRRKVDHLCETVRRNRAAATPS